MALVCELVCVRVGVAVVEVSTIRLLVVDVVLGLVVVEVVFDCVLEVLAESESVEEVCDIELVLAAFVVCGAVDGEELLVTVAAPGQIAPTLPAKNTVMILVPSSLSLPQALLTLSTISSIASTHPELQPFPPVKSEAWHPLISAL